MEETQVVTFWGQWLGWIIAIAVIGLVWTIYIFKRRRNFQDGPKKGRAARPGKVRRENPPD